MPSKWGGAVSLIPALAREGHTPTSALREIRAQGFSIGDQTWRRAWAETVAHMEQIEAAEPVPLHRIAPMDAFGTALRPKARGPLYQVQLAIHDPTTGEVSFHSWGVRSRVPISEGRVLAMAVQSWMESQSRGRGTPEGRALGGFIESRTMLVGPEDVGIDDPNQ